MVLGDVSDSAVRFCLRSTLLIVGFPVDLQERSDKYGRRRKPSGGGPCRPAFATYENLGAFL
jgi:hypothetical protein